MKPIHLLLSLLLITGSCQRNKSSRQTDHLYSRHLQRQVNLVILNTPVPDDKSKLNLLLLNDGQDLHKLRVGPIVDSLYRAGAIQPLVVVGILAGDRMQEYGVAGRPDYAGRGRKAGYYDAFVNGELYPFVKKRAGVRKFHSLAIAGWSLGGLSAFDIAWNHADKIDRVGVFSGSFWWRDKESADSTYSDYKNRILFARLRASRKKPALQFWFSAGTAEEKSDRDRDGIIDVVDDTRDLIQLLKRKNIPGSETIVYHEIPGGRHDYSDWEKEFPAFLIWAFPK